MVTEPRMGKNYVQADSSGADNEVTYFRSVDKPIFFSKEDLYKWVWEING